VAEEKTPDTTPESPAGSASPAPPELGVFDLLKQSWALYRANARALILTCAVIFVPASLLRSCAYAAVTAPTVTATANVEANAQEVKAAQQALQDAYASKADAKTIQRLQAEVGRKSMETASAFMGSFTSFILGVLGTLITTFFVYGIVVPLTNGALTLLVADRSTGGQADWREAWARLGPRAAPLLATVIPAACLIAIGFVFFVLPGFILGLVFAFVAPVVLLEGKRGRAALRRSVDLVGPDWLRVALMVVVLGVLNWLAQIVVAIFIPRHAIFTGALLSDLVTMAVLPLPIVAMSLLYLDIRRRRGNLTDAQLRAELDALSAS
jgi:hypothetical protein